MNSQSLSQYTIGDKTVVFGGNPEKFMGDFNVDIRACDLGDPIVDTTLDKTPDTLIVTIGVTSTESDITGEGLNPLIERNVATVSEILKEVTPKRRLFVLGKCSLAVVNDVVMKILDLLPKNVTVYAFSHNNGMLGLTSLLHEDEL